MEEEKKNKLKKILSYIGCGIGCFILGLCVSNCANNKGKKASNVNNNTQNELVQNVQHKNIEFIDDEVHGVHGVVFSIYDLNNCTWENFANVLNDDVNHSFEYPLAYGDIDIDYSDFVADESISWANADLEVYFYLDTRGYKFEFFNDQVVLPFEYYVTIYCDSEIFDDVKSAIQQDIEYNNQHYQQSIFGGLTESLVDFIGVIGSGFTSVFTIFYASGHITTFGTLSLIVVGVAIAYFLFRFIIGLIRLRG